MEIVIPDKKIPAIVDGRPVITISINALTRANPNVFSDDGKHGYSWGKIGLTTIRNYGKSQSRLLEESEVRRVFSKLPDDFVMPVRESFCGVNQDRSDRRKEKLELLIEIRDLLKRLVGAWLPSSEIENNKAPEV